MFTWKDPLRIRDISTTAWYKTIGDLCNLIMMTTITGSASNVMASQQQKQRRRLDPRAIVVTIVVLLFSAQHRSHRTLVVDAWITTATSKKVCLSNTKSYFSSGWLQANQETMTHFRSHRLCAGLPLKLAPVDSNIDDATVDSVEEAESATTEVVELPSLDPYSETAISIMSENLRLSSKQIQLLQQYTELLVEWNAKINLISRKDCNLSTVFARHILPSLAYSTATASSNLFATTSETTVRCMDVGTGGGLPGIPLAIQYMDASCEFVLIDSIGKKITAVQDMIDQLGLTSTVQSYHGRAEEYVYENDSKKASFDIVTGRSVTELNQFFGYTFQLLNPNTGHVVYWDGGARNAATTLTEPDSSISVADHIQPITSDKYVHTYKYSTIQSSIENSNINLPKPQKASRRRPKTKRNKSKKIKGAWRDRDAPKQRGYENFKRYNSTVAAKE